MTTITTSDTGEAPRVSQSTYLKTSFLEALAHELRGPSGVTLGALDELELALGDNAAQYASLFAMARRGVRRVLRSADRLSRTAQLELSGPVLSLEPIDLNGLVERALREAELVEGRRGVTSELKRWASPLFLRVDANWLGAAVAEVIAAALRSARRSILVELQESAESARIIVCDDGVATNAPRLRRFEPSEDRRDTGLGFPMIKEVLDAHGGELSIRGGDSGGLLVILTLRKQ
jgi:signal transduction histidine kinase